MSAKTTKKRNISVTVENNEENAVAGTEMASTSHAAVLPHPQTPISALKPAKRSRRISSEPPNDALATGITLPSRRAKRGPAAIEVVKPAAKRGKIAVPVTAAPAEEGPMDSELEEIATAILCDGCDKEYFCDAVGLTEVPEGDWYCTSCTKKRAKSQPALKPKVAALPARRSARAK